MGSFFDTIITYIEMAWTFFNNTVQALISFVSVLIGAYYVPQQLYMVLPPIIGASVTAVCAVAVVKLLAGR